MNSAWHLYISVAKSIIRIVSCIVSLVDGRFEWFAIGFVLAELLGILEEIGDKR